MSEVKKSGHSHHQRGRFSGKIGYVLAVAGSAVGLGKDVYKRQASRRSVLDWAFRKKEKSFLFLQKPSREETRYGH